jgi:four helix bundle protein
MENGNRSGGIVRMGLGRQMRDRMGNTEKSPDKVTRKPIECFEDLRVWQKGIAFVKRLYEVTSIGRLSKDFGLRDQLRRAGVSIPANIAEGFERSSRKESLQFLNVAKGSAGELRCLLRVALEVGYLDETRYEALRSGAIELSSYLANQMKSLRSVA